MFHQKRHPVGSQNPSVKIHRQKISKMLSQWASMGSKMPPQIDEKWHPGQGGTPEGARGPPLAPKDLKISENRINLMCNLWVKNRDSGAPQRTPGEQFPKISRKKSVSSLGKKSR